MIRCGYHAADAVSPLYDMDAFSFSNPKRADSLAGAHGAANGLPFVEITYFGRLDDEAFEETPGATFFGICTPALSIV